MTNSGSAMQFCAIPPAAPFTKFISSNIHYKMWDEITYAAQTSTVQPLKFRDG